MIAPLDIPPIEVHKRLFLRGCFDFITEHPTNGSNLKQQQALTILTQNNITELAYGGAAGGAKSWTGCTWLMFMCLIYPDTKWFIGRESLKDIRDSTLITFYKVAKMYGVFRKIDFDYNGQDNFILFTNGSRIDLVNLEYLPSDPLYERYGSKEYTGGFLEECGQIHFNAFDILKTRIGRHNNDKYGIKAKLFLTFNPKKNWIYSTFVKPSQNNTLLPFQFFIKSLVTDNPHRESDYEEKLKSITNKVQRERLLYGNFEYDDDPSSLIDYDAILQLWRNNHLPEGEKFITCDVARFGRDKTVIAVWNGWRLIRLETYAKTSIEDVVKHIARLRTQYQIPVNNCLADEDGVGGGVVDFSKIKGFVNNSSPLPVKDSNGILQPDNYRNLKSQCSFRVADRINTGGVFIECELPTDVKEQLIGEIEQVKQKNMDKDGKKEVLGKDEIKAIIGRSPDIWDVIMMREYFELVKREFFFF